jgi:hypothetical protein
LVHFVSQSPMVIRLDIEPSTFDVAVDDAAPFRLKIGKRASATSGSSGRPLVEDFHVVFLSEIKVKGVHINTVTIPIPPNLAEFQPKLAQLDFA